MKWFQENRWIGMFLIVVGICVLFAAILLYWTRAKWNDARQVFDTAAAERSRLQGLDPFPNDANYRKLKVHLENYSAALDQFKEELKKEVAPAPPLAPNEFQSRLRQAVIATLNRAHANNVKLPDKFQLGFDEFTTAMPKTPVAPLLGQELSQIQMLINILLDAKVDSVTSFHRAPLPEEKGPSPTPTPARVPGQRPAAAIYLLTTNGHEWTPMTRMKMTKGIFRVSHASRVLVTASRRHEVFQTRSQSKTLSIFAAASRILKERGQFTQ